ncbi:MAG: class I SAM-dependent methyltransferase [Caulobacterales bacterium]|nr:class I SAM-dependent methyltransferase [Caulobacterales bacterium]
MNSKPLRALAARVGLIRPSEAEPPPPATWRDFPRESLHHFDEPALPLQPYGVPVPSYALRTSAGTGDLAMFLGIGEAWAQIVSRFLPEAPVVLDLGCGCGKLARFLHLNPALRYVGVDIFLPSILWCRRAFEGSKDRFRFEHVDGRSVTYNPDGAIPTTAISLPVEPGGFDAVVCGSLFTHLLEPDAVHYLGEIARVLKPGGRAFISLHVDVPPGARFVGDEDRIDVDEGYFLDLCAAAGLEDEQRLGVVYGQVVRLLRKPR